MKKNLKKNFKVLFSSEYFLGKKSDGHYNTKTPELNNKRAAIYKNEPPYGRLVLGVVGGSFFGWGQLFLICDILHPYRS